MQLLGGMPWALVAGGAQEASEDAGPATERGTGDGHHTWGLHRVEGNDWRVAEGVGCTCGEFPPREEKTSTETGAADAGCRHLQARCGAPKRSCRGLPLTPPRGAVRKMPGKRPWADTRREPGSNPSPLLWATFPATGEVQPPPESGPGLNSSSKTNPLSQWAPQCPLPFLPHPFFQARLRGGVCVLGLIPLGQPQAPQH